MDPAGVRGGRGAGCVAGAARRRRVPPRLPARRRAADRPGVGGSGRGRRPHRRREDPVPDGRGVPGRAGPAGHHEHETGAARRDPGGPDPDRPGVGVRPVGPRASPGTHGVGSDDGLRGRGTGVVPGPVVRRWAARRGRQRRQRLVLRAGRGDHHGPAAPRRRGRRENDARRHRLGRRPSVQRTGGGEHPAGHPGRRPVGVDVGDGDLGHQRDRAERGDDDGSSDRAAAQRQGDGPAGPRGGCRGVHRRGLRPVHRHPGHHHRRPRRTSPRCPRCCSTT